MNRPQVADFELTNEKLDILHTELDSISRLKEKCSAYYLGSCYFIGVCFFYICISNEMGNAQSFLIFCLYVLGSLMGGIGPFAFLALFLLFLFKEPYERYFYKKTVTLNNYQNYLQFKRAQREFKSFLQTQKTDEIRRTRELKRRNFVYWQNLSPYDFEKEVGQLYKLNGYDVKVTPGSGDGGVDIVIKRNSVTYLVQCKRHKTKVGPSTIRELYGVMVSKKVKNGIVVCPAGFTGGAWDFAKNKNIKLVGLKRLIEMA
jgi:HJR/Mrr/RecB family endonuclease